MKTNTLIALLILIFPGIVWGADKHILTSEPDTSRESPQPHPLSHSPWLYIKNDPETGYKQVYIQHIEQSQRLGTETVSEVRLTSSKFDKSLPKWGPMEVDVSYEIPNDSALPSVYKENCQIFYYLGYDKDLSVNKLYLGCLETSEFDSFYSISDVAAFESKSFFDVPLTGFDSSTRADDFNIVDYDAEPFYPLTYVTGSTTTSASHPTSSTTTVTLYQLVLITKTNELHHVAFHPQHLHQASYDPGYLMYDASGFSATVSGLSETMRWSSKSSSPFSAYRHPQFFNFGKNIVFSGQDSSGTWNLATIGFSGQNETPITSLGRDISRPKVIPSTTQHIFNAVFTLSMDSTHTYNQIGSINFLMNIENQFAGTKIPLSSAPNGWCEKVDVLTADDMHRQSVSVDNALFHYNVETSTRGSAINGLMAKSLVYTVVGDDGRADVAYGEHTMDCSPSSTTMVTQGQSNPLLMENILTCNHHNNEPQILPSFNTNSSGYLSEPPFAVLQTETLMDGSDTRLVRLYNVPQTGTCADSCTQDADGSAVDSDEDMNSDGTRDSCEEQTEDPPVEQVPATCTANANGEPLTSSDDADGDGLRDTAECDNCISVANADQADADGDGIGDVCEAPVTITPVVPAAPAVTAESCEMNGGEVMDIEALGLNTADAWVLSTGSNVTVEIDGIEHTVTPITYDGMDALVAVTSEAGTVDGVVCLSKNGEVGLYASGSSSCSLNQHSKQQRGYAFIILVFSLFFCFRSPCRRNRS